MISPSSQAFPWLVLVILCTFSTVLNAYDLSKRLKPQGPLGVALDYSLATTWPADIAAKDVNDQVNRNWLWSSHITFAEPVTPVNGIGGISDNQLWQIALDAYAEMKADLNEYGINAQYSQPRAMTVLAFGNEIILASSQKGSSFTYTFGNEKENEEENGEDTPVTRNTPVLKSLKLCQMVWKDAGQADVPHQSEGSCGEQMVAHLYYSIYPDDSHFLSTQRARVGTVTLKGKVKNGILQQRDPCGDPQRDTWGCNLFTTDQDLQVLDVNLEPAPYTLSTLAGGPSVIDQIQVCSAEKMSSS